jgi:lactoylglutathione lyase
MPTSLTNAILGIYETHLPVADLHRSIAFYRDKIGLTLAAEFPERGIAFFWAGGKETGMLGLWSAGAGPLRMTLHFAFRCDKDTVLDACRRLAESAITPLGFYNEPVTEPVVHGWMPAVSVYFNDPDGHSIEFLHVLTETPDPGFGVRPYSDWLKRHESGT